MLPLMLIKRIRTIAVITVLLVASIVFKLTYNTIFMHQELVTLASELWQRSFPLYAPRGYIIDRNGELLATNEPTLSLYAIPYQVKDKVQASANLASILGVDQEIIFEKLNKKASIVSFHPYGRKLTYGQSEQIEKLSLDGIYLVQDNLRTYPYKEYMASLIGFVGIDNIGFAGLESYYDNYLTGKKGSLNYYMDAKGGLFPNTQSEIIAPSQGMSLELTIDLRLQNILEREMENAYLQYNADEVVGIIMDPNNGEILAIGNRPTYDNNRYQDYDQTIYNRLLPVYNSFEPGSTFKAITFASAINENLIDIDNDTYYDKGYEIVAGTRINSWKKGGHGLQTYLEVLENSSNPGFVQIARMLGKDKLYQYVKDFGFNQKTGVDIQGENKGIMFSYDNFNELEQATTAFGQGISVTAMQLVTAFSAVINGGYLFKPHVCKSLLSSSLMERVYEVTPTVVRQVISEETSKTMRRALESVVSRGSGRKAYVEGYRVGGKTGTAQIAENGAYVDGKYILSFIAGAPMNDPRLVCYFSIKNAHNAVQYGGTTVGPIIGRIIEDCLKTLGVEKNYEGIEREYTWMDTKTAQVPNFIGKDKKEVKSRDFTFVFVGSGNKVIDQLPRVGEMIPIGSKVVIMLGGE